MSSTDLWLAVGDIAEFTCPFGGRIAIGPDNQAAFFGILPQLSTRHGVGRTLCSFAFRPLIIMIFGLACARIDVDHFYVAKLYLSDVRSSVKHGSSLRCSQN